MLQNAHHKFLTKVLWNHYQNAFANYMFGKENTEVPLSFMSFIFFVNFDPLHVHVSQDCSKGNNKLINRLIVLNSLSYLPPPKKNALQ